LVFSFHQLSFANNALNIIKHYNFDNICFVERPNADVLILEDMDPNNFDPKRKYKIYKILEDNSDYR